MDGKTGEMLDWIKGAQRRGFDSSQLTLPGKIQYIYPCQIRPSAAILQHIRKAENVQYYEAQV